MNVVVVHTADRSTDHIVQSLKEAGYSNVQTQPLLEQNTRESPHVSRVCQWFCTDSCLSKLATVLHIARQATDDTLILDESARAVDKDSATRLQDYLKSMRRQLSSWDIVSLDCNGVCIENEKNNPFAFGDKALLISKTGFEKLLHHTFDASLDFTKNCGVFDTLTGPPLFGTSDNAMDHLSRPIVRVRNADISALTALIGLFVISFVVSRCTFIPDTLRLNIIVGFNAFVLSCFLYITVESNHLRMSRLLRVVIMLACVSHILVFRHGESVISTYSLLLAYTILWLLILSTSIFNPSHF